MPLNSQPPVCVAPPSNAYDRKLDDDVQYTGGKNVGGDRPEIENIAYLPASASKEAAL